MQAFHSFWSLPNAIRSGGRISFPDFELLTAILSALTWQRNNGPIRMITDTPGADFFRSIGLGGLWNQIDTSLDHVDPDVDPFMFWAGGKLYALKSMPTPCVMLDTDLIIWKELPHLDNWEVVAAHPEGLNPQVYPDKSIFHLKDGYAFPDDWDFGLAAANTAFLFLKNADFRDYYVDSAITFFKNIHMDGLNPVTAMCFAEQRVLPMCAKARQQTMTYLMNLQDALNQDLATHTWGFKTVLRTDPAANHEFCMRLVRRIMTDFPERADLLKDNPQLCHYYNEYISYAARS